MIHFTDAHPTNTQGTLGLGDHLSIVKLNFFIHIDIELCPSEYENNIHFPISVYIGLESSVERSTIEFFSRNVYKNEHIQIEYISSF